MYAFLSCYVIDHHRLVGFDKEISKDRNAFRVEGLTNYNIFTIEHWYNLRYLLRTFMSSYFVMDLLLYMNYEAMNLGSEGGGFEWTEATHKMLWDTFQGLIPRNPKTCQCSGGRIQGCFFSPLLNTYEWITPPQHTSNTIAIYARLASPAPPLLTTHTTPQCSQYIALQRSVLTWIFRYVSLSLCLRSL